MSQNSLANIQDFLAQKRIAIVGVSRTPSDYSRSLFTEMARRGYDVLPVNPNLTELDGRRCYAFISEIQPPPDAALLLTTPALTTALVEDCARAGITRIWMRQTHEVAVEVALKNHLTVTAGECPFMYFENTQWFHRLHGFFHRVPA